MAICIYIEDELKKLSKYEYGCMFDDGEFLTDYDEMFKKEGNVVIQKIDSFLKHKAGMCHDASLYVHSLLKKANVMHKIVYVASNIPPMYTTHSFVVARDDDEEKWICIDVFASKDCIWKTEGDCIDMRDVIDQRLAAWLTEDNNGSADVETYIADGLPDGGCIFQTWHKKLMKMSEPYQFERRIR
jgi:hypothetical protein